MNRSAILLVILINTHFQQSVLSEVCTEEEEINLIEMQTESNKFRYDNVCVDMETLTYDCKASCVEAYQELYKELPGCDFLSKLFGYVNIKELHRAFEYLCKEDIDSKNASSFDYLQDDWHNIIFPTYASVSSDLNERRLLQVVSTDSAASTDEGTRRYTARSAIANIISALIPQGAVESIADAALANIGLASNVGDVTAAVGIASDLSSSASATSMSEDAPNTAKPQITISPSKSSSKDSNGSHEESLVDEGPSTLVIVIPIVIALLILSVAAVWWLRRRKSVSVTKNEESGYTQDMAKTMTEIEVQTLPATFFGDSSDGFNFYDIWSDRELIDKKLNFSEIQDIKVLGSGAFGVVWLVSYYSTYYASKRLARNVVDPVAFDKFVDEVKLVARIEHANIIDCIGVAWTMKSDFQALFEYMVNGDLRDYLQRPNVPRHWTKEKLCIAIDIAEALVYVQSFDRPIVHRDLKSRNVLLSEEMVAKVSDFGSARLMSDSNTMTTQAVGTARWLAPEVVAGESYDHTCDSYSFGAILTELDTNEIPLHDATDAQGQKLPDFALMHRVASRMIKPSVSDGCPQAMRDLVDKCLNFDPKERPKAMQISFELRKMLKDGSVSES